MDVPRTISVILIATIFLQGCASSTMIRSIPDGAKVYVDGQYRGRAPVIQKDTAFSGSAKNVALKLDGYATKTGTIRKEETDVIRLVAGIFLLLPLLWMMKYPDQYIFELERIPEVVPHPPGS